MTPLLKTVHFLLLYFSVFFLFRGHFVWMLARALPVLTSVVVLLLWILSFLAFCKAFSFIYFWRILFNLFIFIFQHSKFSFIWIDFPPALASVDYMTCFCPLLDLFDSCRVWTQRILHYLFIFSIFFGPAAGHFRVIWQWEVFCFFVFINSTGYSLVFTEFLKVYEWAFAWSSKPCFVGAEAQGLDWDCSLCACLILPLVLWFMPVGAVSRRHIAKQWTHNWKKDWCGFFLPI